MTEIVAAADDDKVAFAVAVAPKEGLEPHGALERLQRTVGELKGDYERIVGQVLAMTENTPAQTSLRLTTVEVELGFSADGELGFIAKASVGVEASMTLTFERK
jgi:hypothetical protein